MAIDIITITGGLPRDAELRFTSQGAAVTNFTLANSDTDFGPINHKKVARIMKSMGLKGFTKRRRRCPIPTCKQRQQTHWLGTNPHRLR